MVSRRALAAFIVPLSMWTLFPTAVQARCLVPQTLTGIVDNRSDTTRSFTLKRGGRTGILLWTTSEKDALSFRVWRPDRRKAICDKGPANTLSCRPDVPTKRSEGRYKVLIVNRLNRPVEYNLICEDAE
jgi:hypothetical protein